MYEANDATKPIQVLAAYTSLSLLLALLLSGTPSSHQFAHCRSYDGLPPPTAAEAVARVDPGEVAPRGLAEEEE